MDEEKIFRLAKPVRKGLLHLVFSRFLIILLLLILQFGLLIVFYGWLFHLLPYAAAAQMVFTLIMVIYLFNIDMDTSGKLTWLFLIALLPLPGSVFLAFTRTNLGHRALKDAVQRRIAETRTVLTQDPDALKSLEQEGDGGEDLVRYLNRSGCFPVYGDTAVDYYPSGEALFPVLLETLEQARESIYLEFFILEEGHMWGRILEILTRKARDGLDVRVMYDGMCEMFQLPPDYWKLLQAQGIQARPFAPIRPLVSSHYNYRDHRKILVVDGRVAFTGGVNLADEYINRASRFGYWKDAAIRLQGGAARSFELMFLQLWESHDPRAELCLPSPDRALPEGKADGYVIPYCDCPLDEDRVGETVYIDILYRATDYVHIMTPYLILDGELEAALKYAAQRGVDVKLILPGIPDKKSAYALAKSHYRTLTGAGVQIFEYTPGFVHAKVVVSDNKKAVVGSINLDYRSLYHHFECAAYLYKTGCIPAIEQDFQETLRQCRPVTADSIRREKLGYRILGTILKLIAPLL
ncbi:MAG: cardiolipin synthase [Oscillospiraceae bacterium]|nr:cardiolipin synthase [Oscillospiraceae bacterium]